FRGSRRPQAVRDDAPTPRTAPAPRRTGAWRSGTLRGSTVARAPAAGTQCGFSVSYLLDAAALAGVTIACTDAKRSAGEHQRALALLDRLGHLDTARAGFGAVERRAAAPHPVDLVEDLEPLGGGLIAAVEDETVRVDDRRRAEVAALCPEHWAACGTARAQN